MYQKAIFLKPLQLISFLFITPHTSSSGCYNGLVVVVSLFTARAPRPPLSLSLSSLAAGEPPPPPTRAAPAAFRPRRRQGGEGSVPPALRSPSPEPDREGREEESSVATPKSRDSIEAPPPPIRQIPNPNPPIGRPRGAKVEGRCIEK